MTSPTDSPAEISRDTRKHAHRVHSIVESHRQWVSENADAFGLSNAIFHTRYWQWYNSRGQRLRGGKWRFKLTGEETEDNRIQREVQTYNAALAMKSTKCNVKPDALGRGDPQVKSAMLNLWMESPAVKEADRDASELAILHAGGGLVLAIEEGTGNPIDRTYIEPCPPWEMVVDRDARSYRGARFIGRIYQSPQDDVTERYRKQLEDRGIVLRGRPKWDPLEGGTPNPSMSQTDPVDTAIGADTYDKFVTVLEFCNFRESIIGDNGETYRGRLEVWILDQGGVLEFEPISMTPLPFTGPDGQMCGHVFPLYYMHESPYTFRGSAPVARLLPLNVALNRLDFQIMRDTQRNQRKGIARKGAFGQDQADNLFDGEDKNTAWTDSEKPLTDLYHNIPHQPIAPDTFQFRAVVDAMLGRQQGPSETAQGILSSATAYEVQQSQLFTQALFQYHAWCKEQMWTRLLGAALRAFVVAGVSTNDSTGGVQAPSQELALLGTISKGMMAQEAEGKTAPPKPPQPPASTWQDFTIEHNGQTYQVTRDALDGDCSVVFTQSERTPVTDQAILQFLSGPALQSYEARVKAAMEGDVFSEIVADELAERAGLPKAFTLGEIRRRRAEQAPPKPPPAMVDEGEEGADAPEAPPQAPPARAPTPDGPLAPIAGALTDAFEALRGVVSQDPSASAPLQAAGMALKDAVEAANAGDADALKTAVLAASQALSAVQIDAEGVEVARKAVSEVVRAVAADTLPQTREMPSGMGAPEIVSKEA